MSFCSVTTFSIQVCIGELLVGFTRHIQESHCVLQISLLSVNYLTSLVVSETSVKPTEEAEE